MYIQQHNAMNQSIYQSPLGAIYIETTDTKVVRVDFCDDKEFIENVQKKRDGKKSMLLEQTLIQVDEYFHGKRKIFDLPLSPKGTVFQLMVWKQLETIPYGKTKTYKDIAIGVGNEKAVRAVGLTNGKNPIAIVVPCHRVIGSNGKMVGYASGVWRKEWLLNHEQRS